MEFIVGFLAGGLLASGVVLMSGWVPSKSIEIERSRLRAVQEDNDMLQQGAEGLHAEIARLADLNGTLEAQRNNALEVAAHFREAWKREMYFGDLRKQRYPAVTTDEVELERRADAVLIRARELDQAEVLSAQPRSVPDNVRLKP